MPQVLVVSPEEAFDTTLLVFGPRLRRVPVLLVPATSVAVAPVLPPKVVAATRAEVARTENGVFVHRRAMALEGRPGAKAGPGAQPSDHPDRPAFLLFWRRPKEQPLSLVELGDGLEVVVVLRVPLRGFWDHDLLGRC